MSSFHHSGLNYTTYLVYELHTKDLARLLTCSLSNSLILSALIASPLARMSLTIKLLMPFKL